MPGKIAIITPYKLQVTTLKLHLSHAFGTGETRDMEINTVDAFQGREVDVLVLSTIRVSHGTNPGGIGFLADIRRMNVALTIAKQSLWIMGHAETLQKDTNWASLVRDAKERRLVIAVEKPYFDFEMSLIHQNDQLLRKGKLRKSRWDQDQ